MQYTDMANDLMSRSYRTQVKPSGDDKHRVFGYHRPISVTVIPSDFTPQKQVHFPSCSAMRCRKHLRKSRSCSIYKATHLRREELQCIKRELKVIKKQIDELLKSLEHMDTLSRSSSGGSKRCSEFCGIKTSTCSPIRSTRTVRKELSFDQREHTHKESQLKSTDVHT